MVCCCIPCIRHVQNKFDPGESGVHTCTVVVTELVRYVVIIVVLYLAVWRYAELTSYTVFISGAENVEVQYWCMMTIFFLLASLVVYLPLKLGVLRYRIKRNRLKDFRWRPSILFYMVACALPTLVLIMVGARQQEAENEDYIALDEDTLITLQIAVLGLTITEWMSKVREEEITFDLMSAMATDFFFAYDVIGFIMLCQSPDIFQSEWAYVCFAMAYLAMVKYIPTQPVSLYENGAPRGAAVTILVTMFCNDIPFVIVRLSTMALFGYNVSELIYPIKNVGMVFFGCTQLYIIHENVKAIEKVQAESGKDVPDALSETQNLVQKYPEKRISKHPGCWADNASDVIIEMENCQHCQEGNDNPDYKEDMEETVVEVKNDKDQPDGKLS